MNNGITLLSPAKLNLYLRVINKRPDGYHNLITLFEKVNLCDEIRLVSKEDSNIIIHCNNKQVPTGPKNLIYQIVAILQKKYGIKRGVEVYINKRIPVAAGLAGGSSNAGTVLLGLNKLWKMRLSQETLVEIGRQVGSDVPFFLFDCKWALGTERGDQIQELPINLDLWHLLVVPHIKMYSREVFTRLNLQLTKKVDDVNILIRSLKQNDVKKAGKLLFNDLEESILRIRPNLEKAKESLKSCYLEGVTFSGSGPAAFGITGSQKSAEKAKSFVDKRYSRVFVVRTL